MKRSRTVLLLLVAFGVLAAAVALTGTPSPPPATLPAPTATLPLLSGTLLRVFPDLAVLDIQAIRLENPVSDQMLTLARDGEGQWQAPGLDGELDAAQATSIARTFVLLPYARSINIVTGINLQDFGFSENPALLLQVLKRDGTSHVVAIGDLSTSGQAYYALVDQRDEIFQVERGPVDFLRTFIESPPIRLTN
jgi:hypothetical protein